jgi:hypothetical protein
MTHLAIAIYLIAFGYGLGKFTYLDRDGYGIFIPHIGGYHVSTLESE